jgi:hypothetical protein
VSIAALKAAMVEVDIASIDRRETEYIYVLLLRDVVVYIGRTGSLKSRLRNHLCGNSCTAQKDFDRVLSLEVPRADAAAYEGALIRRFHPTHFSRAPIDTGRDAEMLDRLGVAFDQGAAEVHASRQRLASAKRRAA